MEKKLLSMLLKDKPNDTKSQVTNAFVEVECNFEFAVSIKISKMQNYMNVANQKGFIVWCNEDGKTCIMYGAGMVKPEKFKDRMNWIKDIRIKNDDTFINFMTDDGEKMVIIDKEG